MTTSGASMRSVLTSGCCRDQSTMRNRFASVPTTLPRIAVTPRSFSFASEVTDSQYTARPSRKLSRPKSSSPVRPHASAITSSGTNSLKSFSVIVATTPRSAVMQVLVESRGLARLVVAFGEVGCVASCLGVETGRELEIAVLLVEVRGDRSRRGTCSSTSASAASPAARRRLRRLRPHG